MLPRTLFSQIEEHLWLAMHSNIRSRRSEYPTMHSRGRDIQFNAGYHPLNEAIRSTRQFTVAVACATTRKSWSAGAHGLVFLPGARQSRYVSFRSERFGLRCCTEHAQGLYAVHAP